jgi:nucleotide-binding universal stress UspA family protein
MRNEIVVGLDDSPSGKAALQWAAQQAKITGAALRAVHGLGGPYGLGSAGIPPPIHPMEATPIPPIELAPEELQDAYRNVITAVFEAVSPSPDWVLDFVTGYAGEVLVSRSRDAQLLVVGTREHAGLGRLLVGSVSHYCLSHASCPVVAVPAAAHDHLVGDGGEEQPEQASAVAAPETEPAHKSGVGASRRAVVVAGIDGSSEALAAARYAAAAAEMRGCNLLLVHAFPAPPPLSAREMVAALSASRTAAEKLMVGVAAQLVIPQRVHVHTLAEPGDPTAVLKVVARWAEMLVLGRDNVSWGERVLLGAVTSQVARRVACPLVVVPRGWRPGHVGKPRPVVVALDGETSAESVLGVAFREAQLRRTRLLVLHAEPMGKSARDVVAAGFDLAALLAKWKQGHPGVSVSTAMVSGDPDAQLVRWSRSAALLVVGRPHLPGWGSWIRSVARNVMRQTHCPLVIAPQNPIRVRGQRASAAPTLQT